jgi:phage FluMu gp28-like protein
MNIAKRLRRQIESIYEYTETNSDSLTDISFVDGGRLLFRNSSQNGARGLESVSDILIDECAFVDDIDGIYSAVLPATTMVGDNAKIIIVSTPNGQKGWFWQKLSNNNNGKNIVEICESVKKELLPPMISWVDNVGWCKIILHWLAHPVFSIKKETYLKDLKSKFQLSEDMVNQEYNLSFTNSNNAVFSIDAIYKSIKTKWENDVVDAIYYMGLDTSTIGNDYTVLTVLKQVVNQYHLIAMYRENKLSYATNLKNIDVLIKKFNPLICAIEVNSSGQIYFEELSNQHLNVDFKIVKTTSSSKPKMIEKLAMFLEDGVLLIPDDSIVIDELQSFSRNGTKLEAIAGKHDDIVMSLAFAITSID